MPLFRRRKRDEEPSRELSGDYQDAMLNRLHTLQANGGMEYDEADAQEVEARIRRMFYGAKKEDDYNPA
jgi:hypothetical protein